MVLRPEQRITVDKAKIILKEKNVVYLACQVRTGKSIMSLSIARELGYLKVCFITKKKAVDSIVKDYEASGHGFTVFKCTNFEQVPKITFTDFDLFIIDEAHALGQYPKPSQRTKFIKELIGYKPVILLSGTPNPESYSQIYHQFWITEYSPFIKFSNFYKWSKEYVTVKQRFVNGWKINDYSNAKEEKIKEAISPYMVHLSQEEAVFTSLVEEEIVYIPIDKKMYQLMDLLKKDKVYTMKNGDVILADTPVRLQSLFHQLSSGTLNITKIVNEKEVKKKYIFDESKAWYIKGKFAGQKIAIFYQFIAEGELLRRIFPNNTDNPEIFNKNSDIVFICQSVSGREGTNLSTADVLVMYNIAFSATTYWQARARMQTKDRIISAKVCWIFSENGIEKEIYKVVVKKKSFTSDYFQKVYGIKNGRRKQITAKNYSRS